MNERNIFIVNKTLQASAYMKISYSCVSDRALIVSQAPAYALIGLNHAGLSSRSMAWQVCVATNANISLTNLQGNAHAGCPKSSVYFIYQVMFKLREHFFDNVILFLEHMQHTD